MPSKQYETRILNQTTINAVLLSSIMAFLMHPFVFLGYEFMDMGFLSWFYLVPIVVAIHPYNYRTKLLFSFMMGFLQCVGQFYWLVLAIHRFGGLNMGMSLLVFFLLCAMFGLLFSLFLSSACWVNVMNKIPLVFLLPTFMITHDILLQHFPFGGFPWSMPGYAQAHWIRFFQWIDHTGVFGLNAYIYVVNALLAEGLIWLFYRKQIDKAVSRLLLIFFLMMGSFYLSFLANQKYEREKTTVGTVTVALAQGNIGQDMKWDPLKAQENLHRYNKLTNRAVQNGAQVVIWPETAYPYGLNEDELSDIKFLEQNQLPAHVFFGAVSTKGRGSNVQIHNSLVHADMSANLVSVYNKQHLVPFGEYVPFKKYLPFLDRLTQGIGDFHAGEKQTLFTVNGIKYGSLICFEDVFTENARTFSLEGADVLVNVTNDAWYGDTSAPLQHGVFSQFRALENRRNLLRATNTGLTMVIAPTGEVLAKLPLFKEKYLLHTVKVDKNNSYFMKHGARWTLGFAGFAVLIYLYTCSKWFLGPVKKEI